MPSILIVDDEKGMLETLSRLFEKNGFDVAAANDIDEAEKSLNSQIFDLVLTDLQLGNGSGLDILSSVKRLHPETEVVIMTAYGSVETAVQAIQGGASDYITKPFKNEEIIFKVNHALERLGLKQTVRQLRQEVAHQFGFDNIVGISKAVTDLKTLIGRISSTDIAVLITGESGTGKELLAKVIHHHSERRNGPFIPINCFSIPENQLEPELFGQVNGSSKTGIANKKGLLAEADGGTIFLDDIGEIPGAIQTGLLRVMQEKLIQPVGGNKTTPINVRVIAAAKDNLEEKVQMGKFRDELYYRLNEMPINIPPLRERPEDIAPLTEYFLRKIKDEYDKKELSLSPAAMELLINHPWSGNVRELVNTLRRAAALTATDQIDGKDIIFITPRNQVVGRQTVNMTNRSLAENQKIQILQSLEKNNWNYSMTASQLGIGRTTLWRKIKKYDLRQPVKS